MNSPQLVDHFFRHEYGRLVAMLSRRMGWQHIEVVEDAVQSALLTALDNWTTSGLPENPSAWVYRVAFNRLLGELRQRIGRQKLWEPYFSSCIDPLSQNSVEDGEIALSGEVGDAMLRMLFVCCDNEIPLESQLVLALKTLCGFSIPEIAVRMFTTQANVYKRHANTVTWDQLTQISGDTVMI